MTVDARAFRKALGGFASGITVVTTKGQDETLAGVTVSAFSSVSLDPPLVLFCLDKRNSGLALFQSSGHFVINVLSENHKDLSIRFAGRSDDKWAGLEYDRWDSGSPVLRGCIANLECTTVACHEGGDHLIFIGEVKRLYTTEAGSPLVYFRGAYAALGDFPPA